MPNVDAAMVARIARLARLHLEPGEVEGLARDLQAILAYVASLDELDLTAETPTAHPFMDAVRERPDACAPPLGADVLVPLAPDPQERTFRVPHILGGADE